MIILFGFRRKATRLGVIFMMCSSCHTPAAHALTRFRKYFTLFFIPIIPLGDKYTTSCTMCGYGMRISKEAANQYLAMAQQNAPAAGGAQGVGAPPAVGGPPAVAPPVSVPPVSVPPVSTPPAAMIDPLDGPPSPLGPQVQSSDPTSAP
jgi:zinc ribbon protein